MSRLSYTETLFRSDKHRLVCILDVSVNDQAHSGTSEATVVPAEIRVSPLVDRMIRPGNHIMLSEDQRPPFEVKVGFFGGQNGPFDIVLGPLLKKYGLYGRRTGAARAL